jgi:hypothetical protein
MTHITLSDGRYFSKWIGVKPLFTADERLAKTYVYPMQAQADIDKLLQHGYRAIPVTNILTPA